MADIIHKVGIKAPLSKVYAALATIEGVAGWWTTDTTGESKQGGAVHVRFLTPSGEEKGAMQFEVTKLESQKAVHWRCKAGPPEWIGTNVTFELHQDGEYVVVLFRHEKWRDPVEFMAHCSMKWATFLLSLRQFVETGKGRPAPDDLKIDNWN